MKTSSSEETKDDSNKDDKIHKAPPRRNKHSSRIVSLIYRSSLVSPDEAMAKIQGSKPKPGEPIDFDRHVLPILEERCNSCHHAPLGRSGRLVNPKAGQVLIHLPKL